METWKQKTNDWRQSPLKEPIIKLQGTKKDISKGFKLVDRFVKKRGL